MWKNMLSPLNNFYEIYFYDCNLKTLNKMCIRKMPVTANKFVCDFSAYTHTDDVYDLQRIGQIYI